MKQRGTYLYQGMPLIRMNTAVSKAFFFPKMREAMAKQWIEKHGRQGVGLCTNVLKLVAFVRPDGTIALLKPPFRKFEMWQMANAPKVHTQVEQACACANYWDPDINGPWKAHGYPPDRHHPFCQFSRSGVIVFDKSYRSAVPRYDEGLSPQKRPDEWRKLQEDEGGS